MPTPGGGNAFKRAQVRYRRQASAPDRVDDLDELIDFSKAATSSSSSSSEDVRIGPRAVVIPIPQESSATTTTNNNSNYDYDYYQGPLYTLRDVPDFLYAPQALSPALQRQLSYAAVTRYCEAPHTTNIHNVPIKHDRGGEVFNAPGETMWKLWKQDNSSNNSNNKKTTKHYKSFQKLSWATTGYHYDWTQRSYDKTAHSPMPTLLHRVSTLFALTALRYYHHPGTKPENPTNGSTSFQFTPSACIVNYYNPKSLMGGHRDDLELALDKPIVSLSLGRPAIFLLGGPTKDDAPIRPILVRPGDVMMMGGDCRLNFHGMARLLPQRLPFGTGTAPWPEQQVSLESLVVSPNDTTATTTTSGREEPSWLLDISEEEQAALQVYLSQHRININVRQVYPDGENDLESESLSSSC
mmetsp:Transcript_21587/g.59912  ORF Transcript_21587/g.59912 Transcript_21587/m.59912 type:complete len:411 (+) Transcript_21587:66-1298(+)